MSVGTVSCRQNHPHIECDRKTAENLGRVCKNKMILVFDRGWTEWMGMWRKLCSIERRMFFFLVPPSTWVFSWVFGLSSEKYYNTNPIYYLPPSLPFPYLVDPCKPKKSSIKIFMFGTCQKTALFPSTPVLMYNHHSPFRNNTIDNHTAYSYLITNPAILHQQPFSNSFFCSFFRNKRQV